MRKLVLSVAVVAAAGCSVPPDAPTETARASAPMVGHVPVVLTAQQEEGRVIFETMCWTCHGPAGRGDGPAVQAGAITPPPTFHSPSYTEASADELARRFRLGMDGADPNHPHMQFVASLLKPERFNEALSFIPALSYPPEIAGSAFAGKKIFDFRCAGCHGSEGLGDGPAAGALITVRPANFQQDTLLAARNWDAVYNRIKQGGQSVHGSSMPPWGIVLSDNDIWDLVAYLSTFQPGLVSDPPWGD